MRRSVIGLIVALLLSLNALVRADDLVYARFGDYIDGLRTQAGIPGLAAVIVGPSDIAWSRTYGQRDVEGGVAVAPNTLFHVDGLTQLIATAIVLRCVEEGRLDLDAPLSLIDGSAGTATIRQLLSHTTNGPSGLTFTYRLDTLDPLMYAVSACRGDAFLTEVAQQLSRLAMVDSVPGANAPSANETSSALAQVYVSALSRLAVPYSVTPAGRTRSTYATTTLTAGSGLISTVLDLAQFDLAIKKGVLLRPDTIRTAWTAAVGANGKSLPHGLGWFVQSYNGEQIVWQFGQGSNASSSLALTVPGRGLTLFLLANSDGLSAPYGLTQGDVTTSPFARLFLGTFVR